MLLPVGKITRLFGHNGEVSVNLYDIFPAEFNTGEPLYVIIDMLTVPLFVERFDRKGRSGAVIEFADIDTQDRARELMGRQIFLPEEENDEVRDSDEMYYEDLIGFQAVLRFENREEIVSKISDYIDSEFNPLFVVEFNGQEIMIPANEELIPEIDIENRKITFSLPEGLIDLYLE